MFGSYHSSPGEEVGVVAAFLEVHDDVEQRNLVSSSFGVQSLKVFRQDKFVIFPANRPQTFSLMSTPLTSLLQLLLLYQPPDSLLQLAELHSDDELGLGGHVLEDVSLQPPEHVRTQHVV